MSNPTPPPPYGDGQQPQYGPPPGYGQPYYPSPKKRRKWPWVILGIFVVLVVIIIAAAVSGSGDDNGTVVATSGIPSVSAKVGNDSTPPFGASIEVKSGNSKMVITVAAPQQGTPGEFATVTGTLYTSDVTVQCTEGTCSDINPLNFSAATTEGTHTEVSLGAVDNQLSSDTIPAGQKTVGQIGFDVPSGQGIKSISYSAGFGSSTPTWGTK